MNQLFYPIIFFCCLNAFLFSNEKVDKLEQLYIDREAQFKREYEEKINKLKLSYIKRLEDIQKEIVKTGNLEEALKVKSKIDKVKATLKKTVKANINDVNKKKNDINNFDIKNNVNLKDFVGDWESKSPSRTVRIFKSAKNGITVIHPYRKIPSTYARLVGNKLICHWVLTTAVITLTKDGADYFEYEKIFKNEVPKGTKIFRQWKIVRIKNN